MSIDEEVPNKLILVKCEGLASMKRIFPLNLLMIDVQRMMEEWAMLMMNLLAMEDLATRVSVIEGLHSLSLV